VYEVVDRNLVRGLEIRTVEDAGRGDHTGDAPEVAPDRGKGLLDRTVFADVARVGAGGRADHLRGFGGVFGVQVDHCDPCTLTGGALCGCAPKPASTTTDDHDTFKAHGPQAYGRRSVRRMSDTATNAMHSVEGKVVIVTGSGRGVGRGMAVHLGKGGARVVVAEWKPHLLEETCAELDALGVENIGVVCDIQVHSDIDAMVAQTVDQFGRVDAIINNAQTFRPLAAVADVDEQDVDVFYTSGVKGTLWAMQAVYPHMRAQGWGRIVNFASSMGITGGAGFAAYNASKEAVRALTRTAAREWAADGIVVNAIAPASATHHGDAAKQSEGYRIFVDNCPMHRQGDPELDIGPIAWFLCSDACRYLTGHTFMADGGAFMWA
jgi:NAD(P)-dependent dehydrogenase (short-subunit alcohol dehydrogenase family)